MKMNKIYPSSASAKLEKGIWENLRRIAFVGAASLVAVLSPAALAFAQTPGGAPGDAARTLSLEQCRTMALENNAYMANAALDVRAAWLQKQEALSEYFPRVSATAFSYWAMNPLLEVGIIDVLGSNDYSWNIQTEAESLGSMYGINTKYTAFKWGYSAGVLALQPVYAGGRIVSGNRLASLGMEAASLKQGLQRRKTLQEVDELWWNVVSLEDKISTLKHLQGTLDTLYANVQSAVSSGLAADTDILQIELKRDELSALHKRAQSGVRLSKMNLLNSIGQPYTVVPGASTPDRPYIDSITLDYVSSLPSSPETYWKDEDSIVGQMQESQLLELQVKAKQLEKRMTVGEALPQVMVGASAGYSNLYNKPKTNVVALATVQIPLSDWGKTARKAQRIGTEVQKAENERDYLSRQLHLQVGKLWLDLTSSYDQWQLSEEKLTKSQRLYDSTLSNYEAGLVPLQDLLQAETTLRTDASARIDALIAYRGAILAYTSLSESE